MDTLPHPGRTDPLAQPGQLNSKLTIPINVIVTSIPLAIAVCVPLVIVGHIGAVVTGIPKGVSV